MVSLLMKITLKIVKTEESDISTGVQEKQFFQDNVSVKVKKKKKGGF